MTWLQRAVWALVTLATLGVAVGVFVFQLPEPDGDAIAIDRVTYQTGNGPLLPVQLPHRTPPAQVPTPTATYRAEFTLAALPKEPLFLYIPAVNRSMTLAINGEPLVDSSEQAIWSGPLVRRSALLHLPTALLKTGRNELTVTFPPADVEAPSYLSKLFVGSEEALAPNFRLRVFLEERMKTMALAAHILLAVGIVLAYLYRPSEPLFSWLAATAVLGIALSLGFLTDIQPTLENFRPYAIALSPAVGLLFIGLALGLVGVPPPPILRLLIFAVPVASILAYLTGLVPTRMLLVSIDIPIMLVAMLVATAIVAWGALRRGSIDARIMLPAFFLFAWFLIRDSAIGTGFLDGPLLLGTYIRPIFLAALMAVLMRRLATSLDHLDRANDNLNHRLAEQEAELATLHRAERIEAARLVREQERQRLTRDLHDGISGHLVSIIAMTERGTGEAKPIEQAARQALDDLRLVIYSLDLGDRELPLALANFRERLIPQLQRLGVELDWSIAGLPEVSGVTPGNALAILRILQEAITNALKHGPARRIVIRGTAAADGQVAITVENDGCNKAAGGTGFGLDNMRRRARELNGSVAFERLDHGARLTLTVPTSLPDFEEADAR